MDRILVGKKVLVVVKAPCSQLGERVWNLLVESEDDLFISGVDRFGKRVSISRGSIIRLEENENGGEA